MAVHIFTGYSATDPNRLPRSGDALCGVGQVGYQDTYGKAGIAALMLIGRHWWLSDWLVHVLSDQACPYGEVRNADLCPDCVAAWPDVVATLVLAGVPIRDQADDRQVIGCV